jgi:regulatory protein
MAEDIVKEIRKQRDSYLVSLVSGFSFRVAAAMLREHPLKSGQTLDIERYQEKLQRDAYPFAMEKAVKLLSQRDYSRHSLEERLLQSGYDEVNVSKVAEFLVQRHFLDDKRYAEALLRRRLGKSGSGKIAMELRSKGVDQEIAIETLELLSQESELEAARKQAAKYLASKELEPREAYRRTIAFLARRGYRYDLAKEAYALATGEADNGE